MKLIEVKITIDQKNYEKWLDYYKGGDGLAASSLHDDIKRKIVELGIEEYHIETKVTEQLKSKP